MNDSGIFTILIIIIIITLIAREFWCWYWKQNKIVSLLESINKKLDNYNLSLENNNITPKISGEKISNIESKVDEAVLQQNSTKNSLCKVVSELDKIYKLYKDEIYSEQEFILKKNNWIESLKNLNFVYNETEFLEALSPLIKENILSSEEFERVKYVISGEYSKDKLKKEQELKAKEEEDAKQKREEIINNVKNQTKKVANKTFDKINDILTSNPPESSVKIKTCECGAEIKDDYAFCINCGKKLK